MKKLLPLLLLLCQTSLLVAQESLTLPQFIHLYRLNEEQVVQYREGKFEAHTVIQTQIPSDSVGLNENSYQYLLKKRSFGYFLNVKYSTWGAEMTMFSVSPVQVSAYRFDDRWQIYLYDSTGFVTNFDVKTDKNSFEPLAHCGCVEIEKKKLPKGPIRVHFGNQFLVLNKYDFFTPAPTHEGSGVYRPARRLFRRRNLPFEPGFLILNQSEYRHLDSLHAKAYLMDRKGRPHTGDVRVEITGIYSNKHYYQSFNAKELSPGAYSFDWAIPDSLQMDQIYQIRFSSRHKAGIYKENTFKVTHYTFQNYKISITQTTHFLFPGDSTFIRIQATDQNNIPLAGSKAEVRFRFAQTTKLHVPYLSLPDSVYQNLLDTTFYLEPEKETWFKVPQQWLPYIDHILYAEVKITTPDNDIHTQNLSFQAVDTHEEYRQTLQGDTLVFELLRNKKSVPSDTVVIQMVDRFFSETQQYKTTLPHRIPNTRRYSNVYVLDTLYTIRGQYTGYNYPVSFEGTKTRDSLYLRFWNARMHNLSWELYRDGKRFLAGSSDSVAMPLKGKEPVQVVYRYVFGPQMYYMQEVVVPATQSLTIKHNLPAVAYPGQKIVAEVTVYDFDGKPVKNANLTGVSINSQMPVINPPVIPYFPKITGKMIPMRAIHFNLPSFTNHPFAATDTANYRKVKMARYLHYRLYHSPKALQEERSPNADGNTSLQVVYYEGGSYHYPREVWVNGKIRYLIAGNSRQRNVIMLEPGVHRIGIRTPNYFIEIDSFVCEKGMANVLGINTLQMGENGRLRFEQIAQGYEEQELDKIEEKALFIMAPQDGKPSWIAQGTNVYEVPPANFYLQGTFPGSYSIMAPLEEGMATWFTKDTNVTFYFNPDEVYVLHGHQLKNVPKPTFAFTQATYAHTAGYYQHSGPLTLGELKRRWFVEDSLAEIVKRNTPIVPRPQPQQAQFQNYSVTAEYNNATTLEIQDGDKVLMNRDFIWLENLREPKYSHYITGTTRLSNLKPGIYRLVTGTYLKEMLEVDSLVIDSAHHQFIRLDKLAKPLDPKHWAEMQYHYFTTLNRYGGSTAKIYDAFTIQDESDGISGQAEVNGNALVNLQPAAHSYVVFVHQNGQNRYLAVCNNLGYFRMYDMVPGNYWVQIISASRQVFFASQINLKQGGLVNLQLDCLTDTSLRKHITAQNRVREFNPAQAVYKPIEGDFSNLQGVVRDGETRLPLAWAQVRVLLNGVIIGGATTDENGVYNICCMKPGKYRVEYVLAGYEGAVIKNVVLKGGSVLRYDYMLNPGEDVNNGIVAFSANGDNYLWDFNSNVSANHYSLSPSYVEADGYESMISMKSASLQLNNVVVNSMGRFSFHGGRANKEKSIEALEESIDEKARLDEISKDPSANKVRNDFRTNAFWVPNLLTGKDGKTAFTYVLPDDQTQWINFLAAINRKQQTNLNTSYTRSYKPLSASLRVPDFLVIGDKVKLGGTIRNLTGDSLQIVIRETLDSIAKENQQTVGGYLRQERTIEAKPGRDSITVSYSLQYNNYIDGEERKIKVLSNKVYDRKVQTRILGTGENVVIQFDSTASRRSIRLQSGLRDLLEEEIMNLKAYQYGCVEQTASKLYAMLREKQLRETLGEKYDNKQEIVFLIKRLEDFQNEDGSWGWWKGSGTDRALTIYVCRALILADELGFSAKGQKRGAGSLINQYGQLSDIYKLKTLLLAHEMGMSYPYQDQLEVLARRNLDIQSKMTLIELQIRLKLPYDLKPILGALTTDNNGAIYMQGQSSWGFNSHLISLTMQAYRVLRMVGNHESTLAGMRKFLFNKLGYARRNTFERATIINTLAEEILAQKLGLFEVQMDGKTLYTAGTYAVTGNSVTIKNLGAGVSVIAVEEYESNGDSKQAMGVELSTYFVDGKQLEEADVTRLRVQAKVSKYQKYLVLNVPIPAGCKIVSKPMAGGRETAREYFADHVVIYFESLPAGTYEFDFYLLPQFEGEFTLMPALMENMYEPEFFGREMRRRVIVGNSGN